MSVAVASGQPQSLHPSVSPRAQQVLDLLREHADDQLCISTPAEAFAARLGVSERTVQRAIAELRDAGIISVATRYRLV